MELLKYACVVVSLGFIPQALGLGDEGEFSQCCFENIVYYNKIKFICLGQFYFCIAQAFLDDFHAVFATFFEAGFEFIPGGGEDEDEDGLGENLFDLEGALPVDF